MCLAARTRPPRRLEPAGCRERPSAPTSPTRERHRVVTFCPYVMSWGTSMGPGMSPNSGSASFPSSCGPSQVDRKKIIGARMVLMSSDEETKEPTDGTSKQTHGNSQGSLCVFSRSLCDNATACLTPGTGWRPQRQHPKQEVAPLPACLPVSKEPFPGDSQPGPCPFILGQGGATAVTGPSGSRPPSARTRGPWCAVQTPGRPPDSLRAQES